MYLNKWGIQKKGQDREEERVNGGGEAKGSKEMTKIKKVKRVGGIMLKVGRERKESRGQGKREKRTVKYRKEKTERKRKYHGTKYKNIQKYTAKTIKAMQQIMTQNVNIIVASAVLSFVRKTALQRG